MARCLGGRIGDSKSLSGITIFMLLLLVKNLLI
jgi:hypothetical protein